MGTATTTEISKTREIESSLVAVSIINCLLMLQ
jgi:hypothetical protein